MIRKYRVLLLLGFVLIFVVMGISSCTFSQKAARRMLAEARTNGGYDAIVVPGVPFEDSAWSMTMKGRVLWSKYLFDHGVARNVIYSGSAVYSPYIEAEIMALYAEKIGIPKAHIYSEPRAEHSTENIFYGYHLAQQLGFETVALASDPFQTKMVKRFIRSRIGKQVGILPMVLDSLEAYRDLDPQIDPEPARVENFEPLTEREGWWKRFQGTMGKNIDYEAETAYQVENQ